jgi:molybdopterin converting factor small subunit
LFSKIQKIKINIHAYGQIKNLMGEGETTIELPYCSTLKDLMEKIFTNKGAELMEEEGVLLAQKTPIKIIVGERDYRFIGGLNAPLNQDISVYLIPIGVGG